MSTERQGRDTSAELAQSRHDFLVSDRLLLSQSDMRQYANQWVASYGGRVEAADEDLNNLIRQLRERNLPVERTAIRFIEKDGMAA